MIHWLFSRDFNFFVFMNFSVSLLLLISSFSMKLKIVVKKDTWYDFNLLKFVKTCMWPKKIFHMCLRSPCILLLSARIFFICPLGMCDILCCLNPLFVYRPSIWMIYALLRVLKSLIPIFMIFISYFSSVTICFMYDINT